MLRTAGSDERWFDTARLRSSGMTKRYPWFYAVNDRPVQIVELSGGSTDCLVYDGKTGNFVIDRSYFEYVRPPGCSARDV